jgi:hypothetical protein
MKHDKKKHDPTRTIEMYDNFVYKTWIQKHYVKIGLFSKF